jgi:hypothetical protein
VDEKWLVPHFEKMLYDNAQLLELLALAFARSGRPLFRRRADETVAWLAREMTTPGGAFCASLDADSEGEEGKFYVWSRAEIESILGKPDAAFFAQYYDVTAEGNFEGHNILNRLNSLRQDREAPPAAAGPSGNDPQAQRELGHERGNNGEARLAAMRQKLLAARDHRVRPGLDDKVLADWNGLMIAALASAGAMLDEPRWIAMAERAFGFIAATMTHGDRLGHSWRDGRLLLPGLASDHAAMIKAAIALHEATGAADYLAQALRWQMALDRHYVNRRNGGYCLTADDAEGLVVRPDSTADEAVPNANGIAAQNLVRLAILTGDGIWRERADILFDGLLPEAAASMYQHSSLINALDLRLRAVEIVCVGPQADSFAAAALRLPFLDRVVARAARAADLPPGHPARAATLAPSETAALICAGETCSLPVREALQLAASVAASRRHAAGSPGSPGPA